MDLITLQTDVNFIKARIEIAKAQQEIKLSEQNYDVAIERVINDYIGRLISLYDRVLKLKDGLSISKVIDGLAEKSADYFIPHIQTNLAKEDILNAFREIVKDYGKTIQEKVVNAPEDTTHNA